jgi:ribosomal protein S21
MGVRIVLAEGEAIGQAFQRFRRLLERHGISWELRRRKYYLKPCRIRRSKRFKKKFKARQADLLAKMACEQSTSSLAHAVRAFWRKTGKS